MPSGSVPTPTSSPSTTTSDRAGKSWAGTGDAQQPPGLPEGCCGSASASPERGSHGSITPWSRGAKHATDRSQVPSAGRRRDSQRPLVGRRRPGADRRGGFAGWREPLRPDVTRRGLTDGQARLIGPDGIEGTGRLVAELGGHPRRDHAQDRRGGRSMSAAVLAHDDRRPDDRRRPRHPVVFTTRVPAFWRCRRASTAPPAIKTPPSAMQPTAVRMPARRASLAASCAVATYQATPPTTTTTQMRPINSARLIACFYLSPRTSSQRLWPRMPAMAFTAPPATAIMMSVEPTISGCPRSVDGRPFGRALAFMMHHLRP